MAKICLMIVSEEEIPETYNVFDIDEPLGRQELSKEISELTGEPYDRIFELVASNDFDPVYGILEDNGLRLRDVYLF